MVDPSLSVGPGELLLHAGWVRRLARSLVLDDHQAEDTVQQMWLTALRHPPKEGGSLRGWMAQVVRRAARDRARSESRRLRRESVAAVPEELPTTARVVEQEETRRKLIEAVLELNDPGKVAVLMRYYQDLPPREIARRLGVPQETVRTRLRRALRELREKLDRRSGGDRAAWQLSLLPLAQGAMSPGWTVLSWQWIAGLGLPHKLVAALLALLCLGLLWWPRSSGSPQGPDRPDPGARVAQGPGPAASQASPGGEPGPKRDRTELAAAARPADLTGRAVREDGKQASGRALLYPGGEETYEPGKTAALAAGEIAADGTFELDAPGEANLYELVVLAAECTPVVLEVRRPFAREFDVLLRPSITLEGRVLDEQREPLAGAKVEWFGVSKHAVFPRIAISDDSGRYRIEGLPELSEWREHFSAKWCVTADGWVPFAKVDYRAELIAGALKGNVAAKDWVLSRGAWLTGRVVDGETGLGLEGATVRLRYSTGHHFEHRSDPLMWEQKSSPAGAFEGQAPGWLERASRRTSILSAQADRYVPHAVEVPPVDPGSTWSADIVLWPAATLQGHVLDDRRQPREGIRVWAYSRKRPSSRASEARTDERGFYELTQVTALRKEESLITVAAYPPQNEPLNPGFNAAVSAEVLVRSGPVTQAPALVVPRAPAALIRVLDESGYPVAGASLKELDYLWRGSTNAQGCVIFAAPLGLKPEGSGWRMEVRATGFGPQLIPRVEPELDEDVEYEVMLSPGLRVAGVVLDAGGEPREDVLVTVFADPGEAIGKLRDSGWLVDQTRTDRSGEFVAADLPLGPYRITASAKDSKVELLDVDAAEDLVLRLPGAQESGERVSVGGTVVAEETGGVVLSFRAGLTGPSGAHYLPATDAGTFEGLVPPGSYRLEVSAPGLVAHASDVVVASGQSNEWEVKLRRGSQLQGTVHLDAAILSERPIHGYSVLLRDEATGRSQSAPLSRDGRFRVTGLRPGSHLVSVSHHQSMNQPAGVDPDHLRIAIGEGDAVQDFRCVAAAILSVRRGSEKEPEGQGVSLEEGMDLEVYRDGAFFLDAHIPPRSDHWSFEVPPGTYEVVEPGGRRHRIDVRVGRYHALELTDD